MTITVDQMRPKLLTLDHVREVLAASEPVQVHPFIVGDQVRFDVAAGWEFGAEAKDGSEVVDAYITLGGGSGRVRYQLTKDALVEAAVASFIRSQSVLRWPGELLTRNLNYWLRQGLAGTRRASGEYHLTVTNGVGAAITPYSSKPFSNVRLLDEALAAVEDRYGAGEVMVDYKFVHDLRGTCLRLIIPQHLRTMERTGVAGDDWSVGIQLKNSLVGRSKTTVNGYLFRWTCTNGAIDTRNKASGAWTRRRREDENEGVYSWARTAVDGILGGLDASLDAVQAMVDIPIKGHVSEVLRDVFEFYKVPPLDRARVIELMAEADGELTMYAVMAAITQAANEAGKDPNAVENLLRLGGDLPHAATSRCGACRRLSHVH